MGMMQRGVTFSPEKWGSWRSLLPRRKQCDFMVYLAGAYTTAFATGASTGPNVLNPAVYVNVPGALLRRIQSYYTVMEGVCARVQSECASFTFQPQWYFPTEDAFASYTTMTSSTYI